MGNLIALGVAFAIGWVGMSLVRRMLPKRQLMKLPKGSTFGRIQNTFYGGGSPDGELIVDVPREDIEGFRLGQRVAVVPLVEQEDSDG